MKYTPDNITHLDQDDIFVFGSNLEGIHAGGAARVAREKFGAIMGQGVGLQGQSYAIPTMQGGVDTIKPYVDQFIEVARECDQNTFYVTRIGCGIAGFKDEEIATLFEDALELYNVRLPKSFVDIINRNKTKRRQSDLSNQFNHIMKDFKPAAWVLPQPVLIIGTYDADGTPNAMNAAWGGQWDNNEIFISLGSHATTDTLNRNPEFTLSFATVDTLVAADFVGVVSGRKDPEKIAKTGWTSSKATTVNAPVFDCFPMTMECRVKEKIHESEKGFFLVGEIINIRCDECYLAEDGRPDVGKMNLITFDPVHNGYIRLGERVGNAFKDGLTLK